MHAHTKELYAFSFCSPLDLLFLFSFVSFLFSCVVWCRCVCPDTLLLTPVPSLPSVAQVCSASRLPRLGYRCWCYCCTLRAGYVHWVPSCARVQNSSAVFIALCLPTIHLLLLRTCCTCNWRVRSSHRHPTATAVLHETRASLHQLTPLTPPFFCSYPLFPLPLSYTPSRARPLRESPAVSPLFPFFWCRPGAAPQKERASIHIPTSHKEKKSAEGYSCCDLVESDFTKREGQSVGLRADTEHALTYTYPNLSSSRSPHRARSFLSPCACIECEGRKKPHRVSSHVPSCLVVPDCFVYIPTFPFVFAYFFVPLFSSPTLSVSESASWFPFRESVSLLSFFLLAAVPTVTFAHTQGLIDERVVFFLRCSPCSCDCLPRKSFSQPSSSSASLFSLCPCHTSASSVCELGNALRHVSSH